MKLYEYSTFAIIALMAINLVYSLVIQDWRHVSLSCTALLGWVAVAGYEKRDRDLRNRDFTKYDS